jgi:hypothetical protein
MSKLTNKELESKLEPCIYCNHKSLKIISGGTKTLDKCFWVICTLDSCGVEGPIKKTALQAANIWNKTSKTFYKNK